MLQCFGIIGEMVEVMLFLGRAITVFFVIVLCNALVQKEGEATMLISLNMLLSTSFWNFNFLVNGNVQYQAEVESSRTSLGLEDTFSSSWPWPSNPIQVLENVLSSARAQHCLLIGWKGKKQKHKNFLNSGTGVARIFWLGKGGPNSLITCNMMSSENFQKEKTLYGTKNALEWKIRSLERRLVRKQDVAKGEELEPKT